MRNELHKTTTRGSVPAASHTTDMAKLPTGEHIRARWVCHHVLSPANNTCSLTEISSARSRKCSPDLPVNPAEFVQLAHHGDHDSTENTSTRARWISFLSSCRCHLQNGVHASRSLWTMSSVVGRHISFFFFFFSSSSICLPSVLRWWVAVHLLKMGHNYILSTGAKMCTSKRRIISWFFHFLLQFLWPVVFLKYLYVLLFV